MPKQNTTPQYQLEKPDETDFYDLDVINRNADKIEEALAGLAADAFIPYTSTYTPATHRHTLTPEQTGLALPDIFAARFVAAAGFAAGDTVYLDGVEYTPAYTDSSGAVEAGAWVAGAVVTLTVDKGEGKAYVGAGLGASLSKKANVISPALTGTPTVNGAGVATTETGTWSPKITDTDGAAAVLDAAATVGRWTKTGNVMHVTANVKLTSKGAMTPSKGIILAGLPQGAKPVYQGGNIGYYSGLSINTALYIETSSNKINLYKPVAGALTRLLASDLTDTALFEAINITYLV